MANEKSRDHIEKEQICARRVLPCKAAVNHPSVGKSDSSDHFAYRQELQNERVLAEGEYRRLQQDVGKQTHRHELLELKATQDGYVKDLSTHTPVPCFARHDTDDGGAEE